MNSQSDKPKIAAVIVTYNRLEMLKDAIEAIKVQTLKPRVIVINNGSTDGTQEYLNQTEGITVINQENIGGAGGFYTGMKYACENCFDFVWVMDDDVLPATNALEVLYKDYMTLSATTNVGFLCSRVFSTSGEIANVPVIDLKPNSTGYADWGKYLDKGIIRVESATFVSVFVPSQIIKEVGLPYKEFFIWGDDTEFTRRITNSSYYAFLSGKSTIVHRRVGGALILKTFTDRNRIRMYRFSVRNNIFIIRKFDSTKTLLRNIYSYLMMSLKLMLLGHFIKAGVVLKGLWQGLFLNPKLEYPNNPRTN